jgi:hypothetical protein
LREISELEMIPDADDDEDYEGDVKVLEGFVEGVAEDRAGLNADGNEGDGALDSK